MSKNLSAKYYQGKKENIENKARERYLNGMLFLSKYKKLFQSSFI